MTKKATSECRLIQWVRPVLPMDAIGAVEISCDTFLPPYERTGCIFNNAVNECYERTECSLLDRVSRRHEAMSWLRREECPCGYARHKVCRARMHAVF